MTDFENLLLGGFNAIKGAMPSPTLTATNGVTKSCISTPIAKSKDLEKTGYWLAFKAVCELTRDDFQALELKDRSPVIYKSADGTQTIPAKVIGIEGEENDGDPCIRVTIERDKLP